jgi:uncharacterized protein DUF6777
MRLSRRGIFVGLVILLLLGGIAFVSARVLSGGETVLFQEPESAGPDPFTDPAVFTSDTEVVTTTTTTPTTTTTVAATPTPSVTTTTFTTITQPAQGPFGGSGKKGECDPEKLIEFLDENPERKEAWADVLEIDVEDVEDYVRSLTPVILSRDARVTNYGFKDGKAYGFQSILAEGTAVLIDSQGELVVRCYCGNPLTPPRQIKYKCEGCPPDYTPPPPCEQTCYPAPTTTTTTLAPTTTTTAVQSTTTTRRTGSTTTRPGSTTVSGSTTTTRPGGSTTTTRASTAPTTTRPASTAPPSTTMCLLGLCGILN